MGTIFRSVILLSYALAALMPVGCAHRIVAPNSVVSKSQDNCIVRRAAFDIGSESSKMKVGEVDRCYQRVKAILFEDSVRVGYKEDLAQSKDMRFSLIAVAKGVAALKDLKAKAARLLPIGFQGVATAAFRTAKNSGDTTAVFLKDTGIRIQVISQDQEAKLGFFAGAAKSLVPVEKTVVWDIGGGSMQITTLGLAKELVIYRGQLAAVPFKDHIIQSIQKHEAKSPNPMSKSEIYQAIEYAKDYAKEVPDAIKAKLLEPGTVVIGIGGIHGQNIRKQLGGVNAYDQGLLEKTVVARAGMTDPALASPYSDTEISNMALVLGYMKALAIQNVMIQDVNLADGILVDPTYWE